MKGYKKIIIVFVLVFIGCTVYYFSLTPTKRNFAKRKILHTTHILNPNWEKTITKKDANYTAKFTSPKIGHRTK